MFAELSNYLDEQLDDSLCEELEQHLNGCEPCKAFLVTLAATIEQCRSFPAECPASKNALRLRKQLHAKLRIGPRSRKTKVIGPRSVLNPPE